MKGFCNRCWMKRPCRCLPPPSLKPELSAFRNDHRMSCSCLDCVTKRMKLWNMIP